ncbi:MAG TPA: hypothetical protein VEZ90_17580 [Blastocatellia bacterium]|nr:hypothetical protein [Blastocatellia bacterium]
MDRNANERIDAYLKSLRSRLAGLNQDDVSEIVEELRGHIIERAGITPDASRDRVAAVLAALGSPDELAAQYLACDFLKRAETKPTPVRILLGLYRWGTVSAAGILALIGSLSGYLLGLFFILWAASKPLHPNTAGLWLSRDSTGDVEFFVRLGFGTAPAGARDVLGWWLVPLSLFAGCAILTLTTRFAVWCGRQYRLSRQSAWRGYEKTNHQE